VIIEPISATASVSSATKVLEPLEFTSALDSSNSFFELISQKLQSLDSNVKESDGLIQAYIKGEDIPVHEIMISLGKARTEIQLAVEIRNKMLESYQEITRIQL
jgi:flagellar hook-basal body complex protein FliE